VLAVVDPLSYAVDALRAAIYLDGSGYFGLALDFAVLATLGPALFAWGVRRQPQLDW